MNLNLELKMIVLITMKLFICLNITIAIVRTDKWLISIYILFLYAFLGNCKTIVMSINIASACHGMLIGR